LSGRLVTARQPGQSIVEASMTAMMMVMVLLVVVQFSLVIAQAFSAMYVAQSTARWLAVRIDTIDQDLTNRGESVGNSLPGLRGGGLVSTAATPNCPELVSGKCSGRNSGDPITVTVSTSLTPVMFLPTTFGVPPLQFRLPTSMPAISYTVMLE
jgi:hypothetical protein